jgi:tight adherence protein B
VGGANGNECKSAVILPHVGRGLPAWFATARLGRLLGATREQRQLERSLPEALETIGGAVRAGWSIADGVTAAADQLTGLLAADLSIVVTQIERGAPLDAALADWAVRRPVAPVALAVAGLRLAADVGGAQGAVLTDLAGTVRDRVAAHDDLHAAASQARASAAVLAIAPVAFALFSGLVDPTTMASTIGQPLGLACLLGGLLLDGAGGVWMLRLSGGGG